MGSLSITQSRGFGAVLTSARFFWLSTRLGHLCKIFEIPKGAGMEVPSLISLPHINPTFCYLAKSTTCQKISWLANLLFFSYGCLGTYVNPKMNWKGTSLQKIALIYTVHKAFQAVVGYIIYESTHFCEENLDIKAMAAHKTLESKGFQLERINLYKCGTYYSATKITHSELSENKWFLNARGINDTMESSLELIAERNKEDGFNTLIINGPSVGRSTGWPTPYQLAAGVEAGMQYLEENHAKNIVVDGHSFGAGMTLGAVVLHDFVFAKHNKIKYLFISDRTFDTFQNIAGAVVDRFIYKITSELLNETLRKIVRVVATWMVWVLLIASRYDLNCIKGANKLNELGIRHLIIQVDRDKDHRIPESTSLTTGLEAFEANATNICILKSDEMTHSGKYPDKINARRSEEIRNFST